MLQQAGRKSALLIRDNRPLVFKREDDRARWLYVDVGLENEEWVEILKVLFREADVLIPIVARAPPVERLDVDAINDMRIWSPVAQACSTWQPCRIPIR